MNPRGMLTPGKPTPERKVPASIERPEYAWKDEVQENVGEPVVQSAETIEATVSYTHLTLPTNREV